MIRIQSDKGEGRTFIFIHERDGHEEFVSRSSFALAERVRVVVIETDALSDDTWRTVADGFSEALQQLSVRQCALVGFGAAGALVQHLVLTSPKIVRSIILVDSSFRPHPTSFTRALDWLEGIMPLGLPMRAEERGFDAKPFAQRIRCPALIVLTKEVSPFIQSQAHEIALRIPSAWVVTLDEEDEARQFGELLDSFEGVPVKCPQKNRAVA